MKDDIWIIIPGIGNHQPGENMTALVRSLGSQSTSPVQSNSECHFVEDIDDDYQIKTFEIPLTTWNTKKGSIHFTELYWNDLSTVKSSWIGITKGLIQVILGLRHLISPIEKEPAARIQAKLIQWFFWLLRGPILAGSALVFTTWFFLLIIYFTMQKTIKTGNIEAVLNENLIWIFPLVTVLIGTLILVLPLKIGDQKLWKNWTMRCMTLLAFVVTITIPIALKIYPTYYDSVVEIMLKLLIIPLKFLWGSANVLLLLSFVITILQSIRFKLKEHPYITIPSLLAIVTMAFWIAVTPMVLIGSIHFTPESLEFDDMSSIFGDSMPIVGWAWLGTIVLVCSATLIWLSRSRWFRKNVKEVNSSNPPPRLVFSNILFWVLVTISTLIIIVFIINFLGNWLELESKILQNLVVISVPLLLPLFLYAKSRLSLGLDITLDIINYFRPNGPQENKALNLPYSDSEFKLRELVLTRLDKIIEMATKNFDVKKLVLITHSQGTIFGLDYLSDTLNKKRLEGFEVKLVTMGSPFTHIYQHYFPTQFKNEEMYKNIKNAVGQNNWINIYCSDDYVGTYIDNTLFEQNVTIDNFPINIEIGKGGHTGYFEDSRIAQQLLQL
ncbi:hypothetical protein N9954_02695 [Maribacter sp.]|nr:hypothetical protein [Maribacter sp.]